MKLKTLETLDDAVDYVMSYVVPTACFSGIAVAILFAAYSAFVFLPVHLYAEAECLRNGYPKAYVTVGLERYCATLDGAVTVKITKPGG